MKMNTASYWNRTAEKDSYPSLAENLETDTLIIGGGITGVTTAYCLALRGAHPVLIEAGGLCDGTTGNTTGKITIQHGIVYSKIAEKYGREAAKLYAQSQDKALEFVKNCVKKESIDCQLAENSACIFTSSDEEVEQLEKEYKTAREIGIDAVWEDAPDFPPESKCMLEFRHQAVFHSVRYVNALARAAVKGGAKIYCNTKAAKIVDGDIVTVECGDGVIIKAKHVVQATQFPLYEGLAAFFTRLYPIRTYGVAVKAKREWPEGSYINAEEPTRSIRTHEENGGKILIVVGENHFTARGEDNTELHYKNLLEYAQRLAGVKEVLAQWSAQDYETPDGIPFIGRLAEHSNLYVAAGFGKWGISSGTLAGMMLSEMITGTQSHYENLYSVKRKDLLAGIGTVVAENAGSVGELIKSKFENVESCRNMKPGEGRVINFEGRKAGIYMDEDENVTIVDISCTHMSTELNFNSAEKTWDCPAHGGRFSADGKLLEGPPKNPLKVLYKGSYSDLAARPRFGKRI